MLQEKIAMIESFRHKGLKRLFEHDDRSKLPADMVERIRDILATLDAAATIEGLNRPSLKLHALKGSLKGFWAVTVRANWRIIFRFRDGKAFDVDFVDYH
jgi:proteic killer suppression protein